MNYWHVYWNELPFALFLFKVVYGGKFDPLIGGFFDRQTTFSMGFFDRKPSPKKGQDCTSWVA